MKILIFFIFVFVNVFLFTHADPSVLSCTHHRQRELVPGKKFPGHLIPECDKNGDYMPLQCHGDSNEKKRACQCWNKNGDILTAPSFKLKTCSCILPRELSKDKLNALKCEADGSYSKKQCSGTKCYCVNTETGVKENTTC